MPVGMSIECSVECSAECLMKYLVQYLVECPVKSSMSERKLYIKDLAYQGDTPLNPPVRANASFLWQVSKCNKVDCGMNARQSSYLPSVHHVMGHVTRDNCPSK